MNEVEKLKTENQRLRLALGFEQAQRRMLIQGIRDLAQVAESATLKSEPEIAIIEVGNGETDAP